MKQPYQTTVLTLTTVLFACTSATSTIATSTITPIVPAIASKTLSTQPIVRSTGAATLTAQAMGLLSAEQTAKLTRLPIPIVVPTYLPADFRLVRAEGEAGQYANGDDDSGYAIDYQGAGNTCLSIRSSQDGPRRLPKVKQVQTRFGLVTVYMETYRDRKSLVSFLGIKGNPILISGGTLPDSTAEGGWKRCRAVSTETYTKVLRSLTVVK